MKVKVYSKDEMVMEFHADGPIEVFYDRIVCYDLIADMTIQLGKDTRVEFDLD